MVGGYWNRDTPARSFPKGDAGALAESMTAFMSNKDIIVEFKAFKTRAAERFDVAKTARELVELISQSAVHDRH